MFVSAPFFVLGEGNTMTIEPRGNKKEKKTFESVKSHYDMAREDLDTRIPDWDRKVELFYSYIDETGWPYSSEIFVPQTFTALFEKMARLNGSRPKGRLVPREGGDVIKAKINNAVLDFQWEDSTRADNEPMIAKWAKMDLNARIYGASFALVKWKYEEDADGNVVFDGPTLKVLTNKDCLPNPSYSTIKNWFQYRDYLTISELERVNDISGEKPKYENINLLRKSILERSDKGGDRRDVNYTVKGKSLLGLSDYLGTDEDPDFKVIEIVTEYRDDKKIVFAPRYGVVLQEMDNPYAHRQIPVVCLKYIPVDDDLYGLSEIEPIEKIQKALNALTSQFIDAINMDLYRIVQVNPVEVQMHTLVWEPGKKWLMNNPGKSVVPLEHSMTSTNQFVNVYSVLTSMLKEAMGETSGAFSTLQPFSSEKTATEIQSTETTKTIRDNFNQVFLTEAIKKQYMLWFLMNKQFLFSDPAKDTYILRIVGKSQMEEFKRIGLDQMLPDTSEPELMGAEEVIAQGGDPEIVDTPMFPVSVGGEIKPKMEMDETGEMGTVYVVPEDMVGSYDFIIDVEPMAVANSKKEVEALKELTAMLINPGVQQLLINEGKRPRISELIIDAAEKGGLKGADKYFEALPQGGMVDEQGNPIVPGGEVNPTAGGVNAGPNQAPGMASAQAMVGGQGLPYVGGPQRA